MASPYMKDSVWLQQRKFEDAEAFYQKVLSGTQATGAQQGGCSGAGASSAPSGGGDATVRIDNLERENKELRTAVDEMKALVQKLEGRVRVLEGGSGGTPAKAPAKAPAAAAAEDDDSDSDIDLFGSDDDEDKEELERIKQERLKAYHEKKSKKPAVIAKSSVIMDVKPYDDETDMKEVENSLRSINQDGLLWGAAKLVPLAYGIKKLQIAIVIEDAKVSVEDLKEKITDDFGDQVQSVDIAAFNKL
ncbi:elongation factor 1-delta-like isoform X2 [Pecten maximus]|uniref:elongation factor 1-delta-like isoform X2 n=1 Tax=Pecten maximus TaxID=6579 RepID=UPI0014581F48|nr:elongation factor 1-delta-like isoform X2 [Pecten maximus]